MDHSSGEPNRQSPNPRNLFTMNGIYDFRIYNSVPLDPSSIKYRSVPFHRIINQVFPPMCIRFAPIIEVAGPEYLNNYVSAEFYLSLSDVQRIAQPNRVSDDKKHAIQLQVRIGEHISGMRKLSEKLPQPMHISINTKEIPTVDIKSPLNVNAIDYLHLNTVNANSITIFWPICKRPYYMVLNLVEIISVEETVEDIKTDKDRFFLALHTKKVAMEFLGNSSKHLSLATYNLTLLCPINKLKMKLPARSVRCNHLQCFDLQAFISSNKIEPTWMCPVCMKPCDFDDLKIDSLLLFIINSKKVPTTCVEIEINANGKWQPCISSSESREGVLGTSSGPLEKTILDIDLGNLDSEDFVDFVKTVLPMTNA